MSKSIPGAATTVSTPAPEGLQRARGRYAPSPSGLLHIGSVRTALVAWLSIRQQGGIFVLRLEDLDPPRVVAGAAEQIKRDLKWIGIDWDEGPDIGGPHGPYRQSERSVLYEQAIEHLATRRAVYPCNVSRRELRDVASAPHGPDGIAFPPSMRPAHVASDWYSAFGGANDQAIRFRVDDPPVSFRDLVKGRLTQDVALETGDFVLRRRDGLFAYQLAVVVDDIAMQITEVVRGDDILPSTGRQILLRRSLGAAECTYAHLPLILNDDGDKLSKRDASLTIAHLRDAGVRPEQIVGYLAWTLGMMPQAAEANSKELVGRLEWSSMPREPLTLDRDLVRRLRQI